MTLQTAIPLLKITPPIRWVSETLKSDRVGIAWTMRRIHPKETRAKNYHLWQACWSVLLKLRSLMLVPPHRGYSNVRQSQTDKTRALYQHTT